jgi:Zn finger protein HypA/HybF involved in hydrogenase expression
MNKDDLVLCLANVVSISRVDGETNSLEGQAIERIRQEIGATKGDLTTAISAVVKANHKITPVGRFSEKVRNLEDMLLVSISDGELSDTEKPEILSFAKAIKISQDQLQEILTESKLRLKSKSAPITCSSCGKSIPTESKFCPQCGAGVE